MFGGCWMISCEKKGVLDVLYWWSWGDFVDEKGREWIRLSCEER